MTMTTLQHVTMSRKAGMPAQFYVSIVAVVNEKSPQSNDVRHAISGRVL